MKPLKRLYKNKYKGQHRKASKTKWTVGDEANLKRLEQGEISSVEETAIYGRALEKQNEFLLTRLATISRSRRRDVLEKLFDGMVDDEKEDIARVISGTSSSLDSDDENRSCDNPDDPEDDDSFATEWESDGDDDDGYNSDDDSDKDDRANNKTDEHGDNDNTEDNNAETGDTYDSKKDIIGSNNDDNGDEGYVFDDGDDVSIFGNGYVSSSSLDGFKSPGDASTEENDGILEDQASLICIDVLMSKKKQSDNDDDFEKALVEAESQKSLRITDLRILIQSRGQEHPPGGYGQKRALESAWRVLEDNPVTWKRSETWTNSDQDELEELLQKSLEVNDDE